jgi:acyl-CoA thioester hydrolase
MRYFSALMDPYSKTFTVRWADCDVNGHMRNTSYSELTIDVRVEYMAEHGAPLEALLASGFGPVILREEIDYLREYRLGDTVTVDMEVLGTSADGSRFRIQHNFTNAAGKAAAKIVLEGGWMDMKIRRLAPPPAPIARIWDEAPRGETWTELPSKKKR